MLDVFFNPNYAKLYSDIEGDSTTFIFNCEFGSIQNTFILRKIKWQIEGKDYYDIVTPYGFGGPVILSSNNVSKLIKLYQDEFAQYCHKHNIIAEFIRFHLFDNMDFRDLYYGETCHLLDNVVVNTSLPYDSIWSNYAHKVRKNVNKAKREGLTVHFEQGVYNLDKFIKIYYGTMDRNNASEYYYFKKEYFERFPIYLPENYMFFYVYKDDMVISAELVLYSKQYAYSFFGGTDPDFYNYRPNDFLKDAIIIWCSEQGISQFILGGGYNKNDGIYIYKKGFTHDDDVPFWIGKQIFNKRVYDMMIVNRLKEDCYFNINSGYFPLYRSS